MAHYLDFSNGRANIAFAGSRSLIWHEHGQEMPEGATMEQWAKAAGFFDVIRTPAYHQKPDGSFERINGWSYLTRNDTLSPLGYVSDNTYKIAQPVTLLEALDRYVSVDDRFTFSVAGCLDGGKKVWATAQFNGDVQVGGSAHKIYLLGTTSFDATMATIFKLAATRVVCNNTLQVGLGEATPTFKVLHSKQFDPKVAGQEVARMAAMVNKFKTVGDAMATVDMADEEVSKLFKHVLDIPLNIHDKDEISTRKWNQFCDLRSAYSATVSEGTERGKVWTALNAVTRYVDHDRSSRNGDNAESARFDSANFGSGANLKAKAWSFLMPLIKDKVAA